MKDKVSFVFKAMVAHFMTYLICGIIFSNLFCYSELYKVGNTQYFMREVGGISSMIGIVSQVLRGFLFGLILLLFKDSFWKKRYGWLRLWLVIVGIGIICTPGPAPCSMEGLIYTQLPLELHIKGAPEILVQTLLFSIWMTNDFKIKVSTKVTIVITMISTFLYCINGLILSALLKVDYRQCTSDALGYVIMVILLGIVAVMTNKFVKGKLKSNVYYLICYITLAVIPTLYNYLMHSVLSSPLSLIVNAIPIILIWSYVRLNHQKIGQII